MGKTKVFFPNGTRERAIQISPMRSKALALGADSAQLLIVGGGLEEGIVNHRKREGCCCVYLSSVLSS